MQRHIGDSPERISMKELLGKVQLLAPEKDSGALSRFLESTQTPERGAFCESRIDSIQRLSQAILKDKKLRKDPSCVALGYWLRKSNLNKMQQSLKKSQAAQPNVLFVPTGRVFHIAPANVDTLFVYSWALSYVCGNANIVRLSTTPSETVEALLRVISECMRSDPELLDSNFFLTYEHDTEISTTLSSWCTHRIVWGGNDTVQAIRAIPLNPHASERAFATKFSYSIFSLAQWATTSEAHKTKSIEAFFNDAFWFDQMACSSPHILFWLGRASKFQESLVDFETRLEKELRRRQFKVDASTAMKRANFLFEIATRSDIRAFRGIHVGIECRNRKDLDKTICGGGLLQHAHVEDVGEIAEFAGQEDQTVTHFGLSENELRSLALSLGSKGVDRLVPVGEALSFEANWDGYDLVQDFIRRVVVRR